MREIDFAPECSKGTPHKYVHRAGYCEIDSGCRQYVFMCACGVKMGVGFKLFRETKGRMLCEK